MSALAKTLLLIIAVFTGILSSPAHLKGITLVPLYDPPQAPLITSLESTENGILLQWEPRAGDVIAQYYIERQLPGGDWLLIASLDKDQTEYLDTDLMDGLPSYRVMATNLAGESPFSPEQQLPGTSTKPTFDNLSTRGFSGLGPEAMIAGFTLEVPEGSTQGVIIRILGPTLAEFGITGHLPNPTLEVYSGADRIAAMDNWEEDPQSAGRVSSENLAPLTTEPALFLELPSGAYTAIAGGGEGTVLFEVYLLERENPDARLINLSTRGMHSDQDPMIAGFSLVSVEAIPVVARVQGPSLENFGLSGVAPDPAILLYTSGESLPLTSNDQWEEDSGAGRLTSWNLEPNHPLEAALAIDLSSAVMTSVTQGPAGLALVELYLP